jgi:hypothetical protein
MVFVSHSQSKCSKSFGELALAAKAAETSSAPTIVPFWHLEPAGNSLVHGEELIAINETLQGEDNRTRVDPKHYSPGGKYRSIVKLFLRFENSSANSWPVATGWLIKVSVYCAYNISTLILPQSQISSSLQVIVPTTGVDSDA